jgi:hypothetical protein
MANKRQIVSGVNFFAEDNDDHYPASVAKVGFTDRWNWSNPNKLIADDLPVLGQSRSVGASLASYVDKASSMVCPQAPSRFQYLDNAWAQGDGWDNPDTPMKMDTLDGNYCFYWNYVGYLGEKRPLFLGPQRPSGGRKTSKLLVTDYLGFNYYRTPGAYVSCERFASANILPPTDAQSACWTTAPDPNKPSPQIPVHAGYTDGHVEAFSSMEVAPLRVIKDRAETIPYDDAELGPGIFYLPAGKF